ncbi:protocadherin gamma-C5-like isoform 5-T5 [Discoglossus pictus]
MGSEGSRQYFAVNWENGALTVNEKIDREKLCGSSSNCLLPIEVVIENPLELHRLVIEILDINDNPPIFSTAERTIKITELIASPGARFPLDIAHDLDVGNNNIKQYKLDTNSYFSLSVKKRKDGTLIPELVLERALDREEIDKHNLILTALDGGEPPKSGTLQIHVIVLDLNDNAPTFNKSYYKINLQENIPLNTILLQLNATDRDEGVNGEIEYSFDDHTPDYVKKIFALNEKTGVISTKGFIDFEESSTFEISVIAKDKGVPELEGRCIIQVEVEDANDNSPEIVLTSLMKEIPEDAAVGTVVGLFSVKDQDSGKNGEVILELSSDLPFKFKSSDDHYSLVTDGLLDREKIPQYVIELIARDMGSPALHTKQTIIFNISDINDNPPTFSLDTFSASIMENNDPGQLLIEVSAFDPDEGENANLMYSILDSQVEGSPISSFVYINSESGKIYAQRSFDFEQVQVLQVPVRVEDSGLPKLFSNTTVLIFILDTNDNAPTILYPAHPKEYIVQHKTPKSTSGGYLLTKVTAVDSDSGHNALLSYTILQASDPSLFQVSTQTGEIRTLRDLEEMGNAEQSLVIAQAQPNTEWRFSQAQRPGTSGAAQPTEEAGVWPNNQFETERLQAMILASANEAAEGTSGLGGGTGTMGLSARYGPQFTLQHVPDYRQNVYIPGSTLTPTNAAGKRDGKSGKKKSGKKEKK